MNDNALIAIIVISIFVGVAIGSTLEQYEQHTQAAQTQCARYHPNTGEFEWIEKVDK